MKTDIEMIRTKVGHVNVDVIAGWEAGMRGRERIGGKLYERLPADHLTRPRRLDWYAGQNAAKLYRSSVRRVTWFTGYTSDGETVEIRRSGWVGRKRVISQMARRGVAGDVRVLYFHANGNLARTVNVGI